MKTIILIRHAKSDWNDHALSDHDRPLNERGRADAPFMAKWLSGEIQRPHRLIVSSALRAQQTAKHFINAWAMTDDDVVNTKAIYLAAPDDVKDQIRWIATESDEVIGVVGHNPTLSLLLEEWSGEDAGMPTCCIAVLRFPDAASWSDLGRATVLLYATPKGLRASAP
jgi:phosphohistidine phosphatase